MNYIQFSEKEYQAIINRLDELRTNLKAEDIIYDNSDALRILKVSRRTLQSWRDEGLIDFYQIGAKIYYTQESLNNFLQRHAIKHFS
jgi:hypothetical protein